jgi:hypothetical protein
MKASSSLTESRFGSGPAVASVCLLLIDGKGELNRFALKFDVGGIPTMWLVDRKGVLRDLNAVNNLTGKIEKLLNE